MSDTFQNLADRAACERQIIRRSQFSKKIFSGRIKPAKKLSCSFQQTENIIVC